jgi:hypothetical protein
MLVYVCPECMPEGLSYFDGPEDPRECIVCLRAVVCHEVNPADAIRNALPKAGSKPASSSVPPSPVPAPPVAPLPPAPPLPSLPALGGLAGK